MERDHYRDRIKECPLPVLQSLEVAHEGILETNISEEEREETHLSLIAIRSHIISKTRLAPLAPVEGEGDGEREVPEPTTGM